MQEAPERNRLKFFPVMMFSIVMGLAGLTMMYQKASLWLGITPWVGNALMVVTTLVFGLIGFMYMLKAVRYTPVIQKEFAHPVRLNFFASISISILMMAIMFKGNFPLVASAFWYLGAVLHFALTLYTVSFWIHQNQVIEHANPALFLPIVGNVLVPLGGMGFVSESVLFYFFSVGIFFWVILFAILFNRIKFYASLPEKMLPTLFIFVAPPAAGFLSYVSLFGQIDAFAWILFSVALFFTFLLASMYKRFMRVPFSLAWWAYVFPLAAMGMSAMFLYHQTNDVLMLMLSYGLLVVTSIVCAVVAYHTSKHVLLGHICVQEG